MAGLIRLGVVRALGSGCCVPGRRSLLLVRRDINTSTKKTSTPTATATGGVTCPPPEKKNWISYGFNPYDPFIDRLSAHVTAFLMITMGFMLLGLYFTHAPDPRLMEWSQREAYIELRRRESLGLPAIDADYHDPATITLPTDEELGDTEIII